jgi:hypothetical protein
MYLKYIVKANYKVYKRYNYKGYWNITFKDNSNGYKMEFDGINSESLRWL